MRFWVAELAEQRGALECPFFHSEVRLGCGPIHGQESECTSANGATVQLRRFFATAADVQTRRASNYLFGDF